MIAVGPKFLGSAAFISIFILAVPASAAETSTSSAPVAVDTLDAQTECMAKAIVREAGNEPHDGKIAVAQTILNRIEDGRFRSTVCGVINQPGQFFRTDRFHPNRDSHQWRSAVEVARSSLAGTAKKVVAGALYFAPKNGYKPGFLKARKFVGELGGHLFYR